MIHLISQFCYYGVATDSSRDLIIGLFCRILYRVLLQNIVCFVELFFKRDLSFIDPTNRSHPIANLTYQMNRDGMPSSVS